jgi:hypothetical protein
MTFTSTAQVAEVLAHPFFTGEPPAVPWALVRRTLHFFLSHFQKEANDMVKVRRRPRSFFFGFEWRAV